MNQQISSSAEGICLPHFDVGSRYGLLGAVMKRIMARLMRFNMVYQASVNEQLLVYIRDLNRRADTMERVGNDLKSAFANLADLGETVASTRAVLSATAASLRTQIQTVETDVRSTGSRIESLSQEQEVLHQAISAISDAANALQRQIESLAARMEMLAVLPESTLEISRRRIDETVVRTSEVPSEVAESALSDLFDDEVVQKPYIRTIESGDVTALPPASGLSSSGVNSPGTTTLSFFAAIRKVFGLEPRHV